MAAAAVGDVLSCLDPARIAAHTALLAEAVDGSGGCRWRALHTLQGCPWLAAGRPPGGPRLVTRPDAFAEAFVRRVLAESGLGQAACRPLDAAAATALPALLGEAQAVLADGVDLDVARAIDLLVHSLLVLHVDGCAGGSSPDCLGLVWISPRPHWDAVRLADALCHEAVHQALFLEDMLDPLFPQGADLPAVVSAIRGEPRPFESAFHAAAVSVALVQLYRGLGLPQRAEPLLDGLAPSLQGLADAAGGLSPRGRQLLAEMAAVLVV